MSISKDPTALDRKQTALICLLLLLTAVGVRILSWQDNRFDVTKVEWGVTAEYKEAAQTLLRGDYSSYLHNLYYLTHPPGYGLLVALIYVGGSESVAPVTVTLAQLTNSLGQGYHKLTAAAFLSMIIPLVVFISLQRYFVRGILAGSVKG